MRSRILINSGTSLRGKKSRQTVRMAEERYLSVLSNIPDVVWTTDSRGKTTFVSPNVKKVFGYKPEEIYKKDAEIRWGRIHRDDVKRIRNAFKSFLQKGTKYDVEYRIKRKDGKWIWVHDRVVYVYKKNGTTYIDGLFSDITDEKKTREELNIRNHAIESLISGVSITDLKARFLYANKIVLDRLGFKNCKEIQGKSAFTFLRGKQREKAKHSTMQIIKKGMFSDEVFVNGPKGYSYWVQYNTSLIRDESGKPVYMVTSSTDITALKMANEKLREALEELQVIFDGMIDGLLLAGPKNKRVYSGNKAICQMLGYSLEELKKLTVSDFHLKKDLPFVMEHFEQLAKGKPLSKDIPFKRKNGEVFYADVNAFPLRLDGKTYLMGVFRDVTERRKLKEELNKYQEERARAEQLALIGTLSAVTVHELSQPLTAIRLYIENCLFELEKRSLCDSACIKLRESLNAISQAKSVVGRLRSFANISAPKKDRVELMNTATKIVDILEESTRGAKVELKLRDLKMPAIYCSNERDIGNLFFALIENAIHAADGRAEHKLIIDGEVRGQEVEIRFADDCGGIEPENADKIFEPFFTTKPAEKGMGLGLCMVQRIVSQAGGRIRIENHYGKGTTFIVNLPIKGNIKAQ